MTEDEKRKLISLGPTARWVYLARHAPIEFAVVVTGLCLAIYIILSAAEQAELVLGALLP